MALTYNGYSGSIEVSTEDECLHGRVLFIDDLITYEGGSVAEVRTAFQDAVDRYVVHCARVGKAANKPYSGTFNVRIGPELHSKAARAAEEKGFKLNEFVKSAIQAAIDLDGVVTHNHQHFVNVRVEEISEARTVLAGMETPEWRKVIARPH